MLVKMLTLGHNQRLLDKGRDLGERRIGCLVLLIDRLDLRVQVRHARRGLPEAEECPPSSRLTSSPANNTAVPSSVSVGISAYPGTYSLLV